MTKEEVIIDLTEVRTGDEFHKQLKICLDFPNFYGMNWNAFWDAITGLVELPKTIIFIGWHEIEKKLPDDARLCKECLDERNREYPSWTCNVIYK